MAFQDEPKNKKILVSITKEQDQFIQDNFESYADAIRFFTTLLHTVGKDKLQDLVINKLMEYQNENEKDS